MTKTVRRPVEDFQNWTPEDFELWIQETRKLMYQVGRINQKIITLSNRVDTGVYIK